MSSFISLINGALEERLSNLHTCMPCRVERFNGTTADVVPLFLRKLKGKPAEAYPKLVNVPISKRKYKDDLGSVRVENTFYEKGDIVLVVFSERALDNVLSGKAADPGYNRKHALDDGIIIGVI